MLKRFDWSDRSAIVAVLLGVLAAYLPWYAYSVIGGAHVAVNGFRASVLGDAFFLLIAAEALIVLVRHGYIADVLGGRIRDRSIRMVIAAAGAVIVLAQVVLIAADGRASGGGLLVAIFAVALMAVSAWMRGYDAEPRRTVREMLGEELPD
ncbi:MAG: hypothetical protein ACREN2_07310 [Candidatus Dormibacteria bacterium]